MSKVVKVLKVLRNNWKKTVFASGVFVYGVNYGVDKYNTHQQMRKYCLEAVKFGDEIIPAGTSPRHVTVILNPAANKRKAKALFEKYCAPLLHLSGISVDILITESTGQARSFAETLDPRTEAVLVAGGDGTLSEVVTGLMRKNAEKVNLSIGALPLGRTNSVSLALLGYNTPIEATTRHLAEATMAAIRGQTKPVHTLKIEVLEDKNAKPVYSLSSIELGAWRDARSNRDKYWYFGPLRSHAAYLFSSPTPAFYGKILFSSPCAGCSRCFPSRLDLHTPQQEKRWWHAFLPRTGKSSEEPTINYASIENRNCGLPNERNLVSLDINVTTANVNPKTSAVHVKVGPEKIGWFDYVTEGWKRVSGDDKDAQLEATEFEAQHLEIRPEFNEEEAERWLSIDNEDFEVRPIKATLLHNSLRMFYTNILNNNL